MNKVIAEAHILITRLLLLLELWLRANSLGVKDLIGVERIEVIIILLNVWQGEMILLENLYLLRTVEQGHFSPTI